MIADSTNASHKGILCYKSRTGSYWPLFCVGLEVVEGPLVESVAVDYLSTRLRNR